MSLRFIDFDWQDPPNDLFYVILKSIQDNNEEKKLVENYKENLKNLCDDILKFLKKNYHSKEGCNLLIIFYENGESMDFALRPYLQDKVIAAPVEKCKQFKLDIMEYYGSQWYMFKDAKYKEDDDDFIHVRKASYRMSSFMDIRRYYKSQVLRKPKYARKRIVTAEKKAIKETARQIQRRKDFFDKNKKL